MNLSTSFNQMDISATNSLFEPEEQQLMQSPKLKVSCTASSKQSGSRQAGGRSPAAASTPVKNPRKQKRARLDDTFLSPIRPANRKLFDEVQSESQPPETQSQGSIARLPSKLSHGKSICFCGSEGHLANHLRQSPQCVEQFRQSEELQFLAGNHLETFIAKATLIREIFKN